MSQKLRKKIGRLLGQLALFILRKKPAPVANPLENFFAPNIIHLPHGLTPGFQNGVISLWENTRTVPEIARAFGVNESVARMILKRRLKLARIGTF